MPPIFPYYPNCRRIFIRNLQLEAHIGAYDHERLRTQPIILQCDVWVTIDSSRSEQDNINDVLNYDLIVAAITNTALSGHIDLQETLVDKASEVILKLPGVVAVRLTCQKTQAYSNVDAVGVESWREN